MHNNNDNGFIAKLVAKRAATMSAGRAKFTLWVSIAFTLIGIMMLLDATTTIDQMYGAGCIIIFGASGFIAKKVLAYKAANA